MIAILLLGLATSLSRTTFMEIALVREPGLTRGVFTVRAIQGEDRRFSRVRRDFDPSYMSVTFLGASREVPRWAVDTLSGSGGWPRALTVAFPGLTPGMEVSWTFSADEFGKHAAAGLWFNWAGGPGPDTVRVSVESAEEYIVHHVGFNETVPGSFLSLAADHREIWIASPSTWDSVAEMVMGEAFLALAEPPPLDMREAVIQAGVAGASPDAFLARARTLISDNFRIIQPSGEPALRVRSLQRILDSRHATPLEAAVLFCGMARLAGYDAILASIRSERPPFPYPIGWYRFAVRVNTPDGALWFEPSAPLSPAGFIEAADSLFVLPEGGNRLLALPPNSESDNLCIEDWTINPIRGEFSLKLDCRGGFDMELREKLGGMPEDDGILVVSEWFRASGIHLFPTSLASSDFFDLSVPAVMEVRGVMASAPTPLWAEKVPVLNWRTSGERRVVINGEPAPESGLLTNE